MLEKIHNKFIYDLIIISIVKSKVTVIVSSGDFINIKIINVKMNVPIAKMLFRVLHFQDILEWNHSLLQYVVQYGLRNQVYMKFQVKKY